MSVKQQVCVFNMCFSCVHSSKATHCAQFHTIHTIQNTQAHDALFATELKKYDALVADIKANSDAQEQVLARLDKQNRVRV